MSIRGMAWEGVTQWTPLGVFVCAAVPASAMFATWYSASPKFGKDLSGLWVFLATFPVFNASLIYGSSRHWRMSIWPLGLATLVGVAAGYWLLWYENSKQRPTPPFAPGPWVALEAAAYIVGWLLVVAIVLLRPPSVPRLPVED